jgi:hypothetical protein
MIASKSRSVLECSVWSCSPRMIVAAAGLSTGAAAPNDGGLLRCMSPVLVRVGSAAMPSLCHLSGSKW